MGWPTDLVVRLRQGIDRSSIDGQGSCRAVAHAVEKSGWDPVYLWGVSLGWRCGIGGGAQRVRAGVVIYLLVMAETVACDRWGDLSHPACAAVSRKRESGRSAPIVRGPILGLATTAIV